MDLTELCRVMFLGLLIPPLFTQTIGAELEGRQKPDVKAIIQQSGVTGRSKELNQMEQNLLNLKQELRALVKENNLKASKVQTTRLNYTDIQLQPEVRRQASNIVKPAKNEVSELAKRALMQDHTLYIQRLNREVEYLEREAERLEREADIADRGGFSLVK